MITIVIGGPDDARPNVARQIYELLVNSRFIVKRFEVDRAIDPAATKGADVIILERSERGA